MVWLDTPADWVFLQADRAWLDRVEERANAARQGRRIDVRPVLFGRQLLAFLAERVLAEASQHEVLEETRLFERTQAIHAEWLMACREDLDGRTPRQWLLSDRVRITRDVEHRSHQWTRQGYAVPPLSRNSAAYRFGGFGTAEVVGDLKRREGGRPHLKTLNEAFASLRGAADPVAVRSAAEQLRGELEEVAQTYPDLVAKSADLQSHLDEVLRHLT